MIEIARAASGPAQSSTNRTDRPVNSPNGLTRSAVDISGRECALGRRKWDSSRTIAPLSDSSAIVGTAEHWTVVDGTAKVRVGEREFLLERNQSTYIPMDTLHRLENPGERDLHLIETQCGDYFGEDDIVRLEDVYGRK